VGNGFFNEEDSVSVEAEARGLSSRVTVTGRAAEADLPAYLSLGDVAIYPMEDNLINRAKSPVKVLEPMLMGLPIVAHSVGEAAEFLRGAAVLVEPGDLRGMARAVSDLLSNPGRRAQLGEAARSRVRLEYTWERQSLVAEEAYRKALALG
jgi:glycosyltransferase involved in cell wall biosynthesis